MAMKTTIEIDDGLLRAAKKLAADRGITLKGVFEDALRTLMAQPTQPYRFRWDVDKGRGSRVDIADRDALYDVMGGQG